MTLYAPLPTPLAGHIIPVEAICCWDVRHPFGRHANKSGMHLQLTLWRRRDMASSGLCGPSEVMGQTRQSSPNAKIIVTTLPTFATVATLIILTADAFSCSRVRNLRPCHRNNCNVPSVTVGVTTLPQHQFPSFKEINKFTTVADSCRSTAIFISWKSCHVRAQCRATGTCHRNRQRSPIMLPRCVQQAQRAPHPECTAACRVSLLKPP
jgi:hypothetical protein